MDEKWCTTKSDDNDVLSYTFSFDFIIVQIVYLDYKTPNVEIQTKIASYNIFRVVIWIIKRVSKLMNNILRVNLKYNGCAL